MTVSIFIRCIDNERTASLGVGARAFLHRSTLHGTNSRTLEVRSDYGCGSHATRQYGSNRAQHTFHCATEVRSRRVVDGRIYLLRDISAGTRAYCQTGTPRYQRASRYTRTNDSTTTANGTRRQWAL